MLRWCSRLAAAICFWKAGAHPWLLLRGAGFLLSAALVQHARWHGRARLGQASLRGEILNDLPDRVSDVVIFAGVAHSGLMNPVIGYWAAIFALLTAYVGMLGQAVGVRREFGGMMSKPWRMVMLHLGAWITFALSFGGTTAAAYRCADGARLDLRCWSLPAVCKQSSSACDARWRACGRSR